MLKIYGKIKTAQKSFAARKQVGLTGVFWNLAHKVFAKVSHCRLGKIFFEFCEDKYAKKVFCYLAKYQSEIDKFKEYIQPNLPKKNSKIIWTYWAQGISKAPTLIQNCWESMQKHSNGCKLVILDNSNIANYCEIPDYVWDKYRQNKLSNQQISNILRYSLVYEYGGIWIDSTFFLTKNIPDYVFSADYWIEKGPDSVIFTKHITDNLGEGTIAAKKGSIVPMYFKNMFLEYWKKEDVLIDFHLHNAWFAMGMQYLPTIRESILSIPFNNPVSGKLFELQDKPFNEYEWQAIENRGIGFYKMNWRKPPLDIDGTFFSQIRERNEKL